MNIAVLFITIASQAALNAPAGSTKECAFAYKTLNARCTAWSKAKTVLKAKKDANEDLFTLGKYSAIVLEKGSETKKAMDDLTKACNSVAPNCQ